MKLLIRHKLVRIALSVVTLTALAFGALPLLIANAAAQNDAEGSIQLQIIAPPASATSVGVQWQDPSGSWHAIDSWTTPLSAADDGYVVHFVDPKDFGSGPFRWVLWDNSGKVVGVSALFNFPTYATVVGTLMDFTTAIPMTGQSAAPASLGPAQDMAEGTIQLQLLGMSAITPPWVEVQWQDPAGAWRDVDGWAGPLDPTQGGYVYHYVDPKDFGKGPFRWVVSDKQGGTVLGMSDTFYFPTYGTVVGSIITAPAMP
jgi:hypothetical protein